MNSDTQREAFQALKAAAEEEFRSLEDVQWTELAERRYVGQGEALVSPPDADFHILHRQRFGFSRPGHRVETVQLRLRARRPPLSGVELEVTQMGASPPESTSIRWMGRQIEVPIYTRSVDSKGPAVVLQSGSTLFIAPEWRATTTSKGHLLLKRESP